MPREFTRPARLSEQIQRELGSLLLTDIQDPRLAGLVVSGVEVSRDLSHARVYLTVPHTESGEDGDADGAMQALVRASGFLRRRLASRLHIRSVPQLRFERDETLDQADRIERLLARTRRRKLGP